MSSLIHWMSPELHYITLLRPVSTDEGVRTKGLDTENVTVETRGLAGTFILLIWQRE